MNDKIDDEINTVALLGPKGATFSFHAANEAAKLLGLPKFDWDRSFIEVGRNEEVLAEMISGAATYGIIAAETEVNGRIDESLATFGRLIGTYHNGDCPIRIICAVRMPLSFALMVKKGVKLRDIHTVRGHPQAIAACAKHIARMEWAIEKEDSNGIAARNVAVGSDHEAALGPTKAAEMFRLDVLNEAFEDAPAVTTFFVLGPNLERPRSDSNRALIVFRLKDGPMALVHAVMPFGQVELNLTYVHSIHSGKRTYDFIAEIDCPKDKHEDLHAALQMFMRVTQRSIVFGPFPVLDI